MIVDTSAVMAIILNESERKDFVEALALSTMSLISAGTWIELSIAIIRKPLAMEDAELDLLLRDFGIAIEPVTIRQAELSRIAYRTFGKGSGHPARLNVGDCFAYALAKETGQPLLFKGEDFAQADVVSAIPG